GGVPSSLILIGCHFHGHGCSKRSFGGLCALALTTKTCHFRFAERSWQQSRRHLHREDLGSKNGPSSVGCSPCQIRASQHAYSLAALLLGADRFNTALCSI